MRFRDRFVASARATALLWPAAATLVTVAWFLFRAESGSLALGAIFGLAIWLLSAAAYASHMAADRVNPTQFGLLGLRLRQLQVQIDAINLQERSREERRALSEVRAHLAALEQHLDPAPARAADADQWETGIGYNHAWRTLHAAEEAYLLSQPLPELVGYAAEDERRLGASGIDDREEILRRLRLAVAALCPSAVPYLRHPGHAAGAEGTPDNAEATTEMHARAIIRSARRALNGYRDELWAGLHRESRILNMVSLLLATLTYGLLFVAIAQGVSPVQIEAAAVFFLLGAGVGLFARLVGEEVGVDDYHLGRTKTFGAVLASGLAALVGVVIVAYAASADLGALAGPQTAATSSETPTETETNIETATPTAPALVALADVFSLELNTGGLIVAALFGFTPGLVVSFFTQREQQIRKSLASTESANPSG